eukprot:jgi/Mesvir1/15620/Mv03228-RA.1
MEEMNRADRATIFGIDCADSLEWRNWEAGGEYTRTLQVKNISQKTVKLKYTLPVTKYFLMDFPVPIKLSPGMRAVVNVTFRPIKRETYEDAIVFTTTAGTFSIPVRAVLPALGVVVPTELDFGFCAAGQLATRPLPVRNSGEQPISFSWKTSHPFAVIPSTGKIKIGEELNCTVSFCPEDASVFLASALLLIDGESSHEVRLHGVGKYAHVAISPPSIDFGDVYTGRTAERALALKNTSLVPAAFTVTHADPDPDVELAFAVLPSKGVIPPGATANVKVIYSPTSTDTFSSETFIVTAGTGTARSHLRLSGNAVGTVLSVRPRSVNFGDVEVGGTAVRTLTVTNPANIPAQVQFLADPGGTVRLDCSVATVPAGSSINVTMTFAPGEAVNFYRRMVLLVKDASPLVVDTMGTGYTAKKRPFPFGQRHVDAYRQALAKGELQLVPPSEKRPSETGVTPRASQVKISGADSAAASPSATRLSRASSGTGLPAAKRASNWGGPGASEGDGDDATTEGGTTPKGLQLLSPRYSDSHTSDEEGNVGEDEAEAWPAVFPSEPGDAKSPPVSLSCQAINFGVGSRLRAGDPRTVTVTNLTVAKVTVCWSLPQPGGGAGPAVLPGKQGSGKGIETATGRVTNGGGAGGSKVPSPFVVFPETADLKAGESADFRVSFRPDRDNAYFVAELECVACLKQMRSFHTATEENFVPPWVQAVRVLGHTFASGREEFMPKASFSLRRLCFPPCHVGGTSHATVALTNGGDTPVMFEFTNWRLENQSGGSGSNARGGPGGNASADASSSPLAYAPSQRPFSCSPVFGVVQPHSFALIVFKFFARDDRPARDVALCMLNGTKANVLELPLSGKGFVPTVRLGAPSGVSASGNNSNGDGGVTQLFFKPTGVGTASSRTIPMTNSSRVPLTFEWVVPSKLRNAVTVEPHAGLLRGGETVDLTWVLTPQAERKYSLNIPCHIHGMGTGAGGNRSGASGADDGTRVVLTLVGEGVGRTLVINPPVLSLDDVIVGETVTKTFTLTNKGSGGVDYELSCIPIDNELRIPSILEVEEVAAPDPSKLPTLSPARGNITARTSLTVTLTYRPMARGPLAFRVTCALREKSAVTAQSLSQVLPPSRLHEGGFGGPEETSAAPPTLDVHGLASYPCLLVVDARAERKSKVQLWRQLGLNALNAELASAPSPVEEEMRSREGADLTVEHCLSLLAGQALTLDLGARQVDEDDTVIHLLVENTGRFPTCWRLKRRGDSRPEGIERWVETLEPDGAQERHEEYVIENRLIQAQPTNGRLEPGQRVHIALTYRHEHYGVHTLPYLLEVDKGKRLRIDMLGRTLGPSDKYIEFASKVHHLRPVAIGDAQPPLQGVEIRNAGATPVTVQLDTTPLEQLAAASYGFPILRCSNPSVTMAPGRAALFHMVFQPMEAKAVSVSVPIRVADGPETAFTFHAEGLHPHKLTRIASKASSRTDPFGSIGSAKDHSDAGSAFSGPRSSDNGGGGAAEPDTTESWLGFRPTPLLRMEGDAASLSVDLLSFGSVPAFSVSRRLVAVSNRNGIVPLHFTWDLDIASAALADGRLAMDPPSGRLPAGKSIMCKLTLFAGMQPQFFETDLVCHIQPEVPEGFQMPSQTSPGHGATGLGAIISPQATVSSPRGVAGDTSARKNNSSSKAGEEEEEVIAQDVAYTTLPKRKYAVKPPRAADSQRISVLQATTISTTRQLPMLAVATTTMQRRRQRQAEEADEENRWSAPPRQQRALDEPYDLVATVEARVHSMKQYEARFGTGAVGSFGHNFVPKSDRQDGVKRRVTQLSEAEYDTIEAILSQALLDAVCDPLVHLALQSLDEETVPYFEQLTDKEFSHSRPPSASKSSSRANSRGGSRSQSTAVSRDPTPPAGTMARAVLMGDAATRASATRDDKQAKELAAVTAVLEASSAGRGGAGGGAAQMLASRRSSSVSTMSAMLEGGESSDLLVDGEDSRASLREKNAAAARQDEILGMAEFEEMAEFMLEGTLFNLMKEMHSEGFDLDALLEGGSDEEEEEEEGEEWEEEGEEGEGEEYEEEDGHTIETQDSGADMNELTFR